MKKIALFVVVICVGFISNAQNNFDTIYNGDSRYFLNDTTNSIVDRRCENSCNWTIGQVYTFEESDSMKVWGMACSIDSIYPNHKCNIQMHLFKIDDDFDTTGMLNFIHDSATLEIAMNVDVTSPSRYMKFPSGSLIKMYEEYFDTAITLVGTYGVCFGGELTDYNHCSYSQCAVLSNTGGIRIMVSADYYNPSSGKYKAEFVKGPGSFWHFSVYLITDSSLRDHRIEPPQPPAEPCPPVGLLSIDSLGARCVRLSWTDSVERCYYEVAMGPVSSPLDSLAFYTTTDTSFFFDHLPPGVPYKAFVRGACDCDGDMSPWGNLVSFTYSPYHLNLSVNNPDWGSVYGGGEYYGETQLEISASPVDDNATFDGWDDGNVENPRSIFLTQDTSFTAIFSYDSTGLGLSTLADFGLSVSPNPVRHTLKVRTSADVQGTLEIYNAEGQRLQSSPIEGREARLDVSRLPSGQYLLRLRTREATSSAKFVKR